MTDTIDTTNNQNNNQDNEKGKDSMCKYELNKQLQGLAARITQTENNVTNMFYGMSVLVTSLSSNQHTSASVQILTPIYNMLPTGFQLMQEYIKLLNPAEFRKLALALATELVSSMAQELVDDALDIVDSYVQQINAITNQIANLEQALLNAAEAQKQQIINEINSLNAQMMRLKNLAVTAQSFLTAQANISKCKTKDYQMGG